MRRLIHPFLDDDETEERWLVRWWRSYPNRRALVYDVFPLIVPLFLIAVVVAAIVQAAR